MVVVVCGICSPLHDLKYVGMRSNLQVHYRPHGACGDDLYTRVCLYGVGEFEYMCVQVVVACS